MAEANEDGPVSKYKCVICFDLLHEPVTLPCHHSLCLDCFTRNRDESNLTCPICRTRISTWARRLAKSGPRAFVDQDLAEELAAKFPVLSQHRASVRGTAESVLGPEVSAPRLSTAGEIRSEYETLVKKDAAEKKAIVDADFEFSEKLHQQEWQQREAELAQRAEQVAQDEAVARQLLEDFRAEKKQKQKASVSPKAQEPAAKRRRVTSSSTAGTSSSQKNTLLTWLSPTQGNKRSASRLLSCDISTLPL